MQQIMDKTAEAFNKCELGFEKIFVQPPVESGGIEPDDPGADCPRWKWRQGINIDPPGGLWQITSDVNQMCLSTDCYLPDALLKGWEWCAREKGGSSGSTEEQMACTRKCMEMIRGKIINTCSNICPTTTTTTTKAASVTTPGSFISTTTSEEGMPEPTELELPWEGGM